MKSSSKIYSSGRTYILWTGKGRSEKTFSGIVVKQLDQESEHKVGTHSKDWSKDLFKETTYIVTDEWKQWYKISQSNLKETLWTIAIVLVMVSFFLVMALIESNK